MGGLGGGRVRWGSTPDLAKGCTLGNPMICESTTLFSPTELR